MSGLSNADFRSLVSRSSKGGGGGGGGDGETRKRSYDEGSHSAKKPKRTFRAPAPRGKKEDFEPEDEEKPLTYQGRDRAKERREGLTSMEFANIDTEQHKHMTIEESKYLGGDVSHTHLVKGLDYALLAKVRSEIDSTKPKKKKEEGEEKKEVTATVEARTLLGKTMRARLSANGKKTRSSLAAQEMFLPGRTAFVYELDSEVALDNDIPTTLSRSKADNKLEEKMLAVIESELLASVAKIVAYVKQGSFKPRNKPKPPPKKEQESASASGHNAVRPVVQTLEQDDIFADAPSVYVPQVPPPEPAVKKKSQEDVYSECYVPGDVEYTRTVADDSDDEGTLLPSRLPGGRKTAKTREDFNTDTEWARYLEMQNMAAAMGGAVSAADFDDPRRERAAAQAAKAKKIKDKQKFDKAHTQVLSYMKKLEKRKAGGESSEEEQGGSDMDDM